MFYRWTLLLSFCVLKTFGQEYFPGTQGDLRELADAKIGDFKLRLHQKLKELTQLREALNEGSRKLLPVIDSRPLEIESTEALREGCVAQVAGSQIVLAVTSSNILTMLKNLTFVPIRSFPGHRAILSLQAFEYGSDVLLLAHHTNRRKRHFIKMYEFNSSNIDPGQKINLMGPSIVSSTKVGYIVYAAVASTNTVFNEFQLFQWTGMQFDEIFWTRLAKKCTALTIWTMEGSVYVALSFPARLEVKRFIKHTETITDVQFLDVEARVIKYFEDAGSHYLACGTPDSLIIYWWTGSSFQQEQKIWFNKTTKDISINKLSEKVVIAVVFNDEVRFLVQGDSTLYVTAGTVDFSPMKSLKSVLLWKSGRLLHMLPMFDENLPVYVHEISLRLEKSDPEKEPELNECIKSIYDYLYESQQSVGEITSVVKNVWLPSEKLKLPSLKVNGTIRSLKKSVISLLHLKTNISSPLTLDKMREKMLNQVKVMQHNLTKVVLKFHEQQIETKLHFKNLTMDSGMIDELKYHVNLNKMNTSRLLFSLKKSGDQTFQYSTMISNVSCQKATTVSLNAERMQDYVLLNSGSWNLTGRFLFGNISARTVFVNRKINGLDTENFVLATKKQNISGLKVFGSLSAKAIQTNKGVGEIHLNETNGIVYLDSRNFSALNFSSDLIIKGNLNVSSLNGYDILKLFSETVKKDEKQDIYGNKTFKSMIINGTMNVSGEINNYTLDRFMTINTHQKIYGNVTFSNPTSFQNIITDSVNGADLSNQAVVKSRGGEIKGVKTFRENLNVSNILMKEGVLIDCFDPSEQDFHIIYKASNDVFDAYWFNNMTVENINVTDIEVDANHFPVLEKLGNVWLRTSEQNISLLETNNIRVDKLQVSKVNNISMQDLVTVNGDVTINGAVHFVDDVTVNTLNLTEGANLNFAPEIWNLNITVKVLNNVTIEKAVLKGNLSVHGTFENFESGFMHVKEQQTLEGKFEFEKIETKELFSKNLTFQLLNKINFTDFLEEAVVPSRNRSIHNKHFNALDGNAMICEGTLNNVLLDKVVTINSKQNIMSDLTFLKAPSFKNVNVTSFLNGIRLEDIVYIDKIGNLSNKLFTGNITTTHLNINGTINGVNITHLQLKSFNKSKENRAEEKFTFRRSLTAENVTVLGSKIDNVDLEDLIRLKESSELESLSASNIVAENAMLIGDINGCQWMSVLRNALSRQEDDSQNLTADTTVRSLAIEGNLTLDYLNGANIPDWILLMNFNSLSDVEGDLEFESLSVENIEILESVNGINVDFLMNDTVRRNVSQVISGSKTFQEIGVINVTIDKMSSDTICGIDTSSIFEFAVNKSDENRITLSSNVLGGLVSKNVSIEGSLNLLKLPTDVVMPNISEVIESKVIINSTVNATAGLSISKINGINFEDFLKKRITLSAPQEIFSALQFTEDAVVEGNMAVNGTINNLRIEEVVNMLQNQNITGTKNFTEDLEVTRDLTVNGSINGIFLDKFLWSSRNESLEDIRFSMLSVSSLTCDTINSVNVIDFYNYTHNFVHHIRDKLYNFTEDIQSFEESLEIQKDVADHRLSLFEYFELHEIIDFGSVQRFLPLYEYGVLGEKYELQVAQMIMWIENKDACRKTKSLIADISVNGTFTVSNRMHGKIFPFSLKVEKGDVAGFFIQAGHLKRCSPGTKTRIVIKTAYSSGLIEKKTIVSPANASLFDIRLLESHELFLIVAYNIKGPSERIFIYQYEAENNTWSRHQKFHSHDLTSLDLISVERNTPSFFDPPSVYLSVTGDEKNPGITIYEWDFDVDKFFLKTNISTSVSSYALWVYNDNKLYLLLAKEMTEIQKDHSTVKVFTEPLEVYILEEELILQHKVNIKGACSLEMFILAEEVFVLASSNHMEIVYVLKLRGFNGFEVIQEIPAPSVTETRVFTVDSHLYLALNSRTAQSRILKASIRGGRLAID